MSHMDRIPLEITTHWQLNGKWAWKKFGMCQVTHIKAFYDYVLRFQLTSHNWRVELPHIAGVAFWWYACVVKDSA